MIKKLIVVFIPLALIFLLTAVVSATHSWGSYHWARTANSFDVNLGDNVSSAWDGYLSTVSGDWSVSSVLSAPIVVGNGSKSCQPTVGRVEVCNKKYGFNGWLGLAQIWVFGGHIVKGTAKMNDSYFNTSRYNNPSAKRHVLCQEVGHTLGLDHQRDGVSCMNDQAGLFDAAYVSPNAHDYEQLETIYNGHFDATSSSSASPGSSAAGNDGNGLDFGTPAGRPDKHGRETLFVRDLGNGVRVYTWVFWAEPGAVK